MSIVSIIGLGYMGLPMACLVAKAGHTVVGVDVQQKVVENINKGIPHFEEKGLKSLISEVVKNDNFKAYNTPQSADIFIIAVPTPFIEETKAPDMAYVNQAAKDISSVLKKGDLVILESTSPVGATEQNVRDVIEKENPVLKDKLLYAFCPERAIPGDTLRELVENDRCVGGLTKQAQEKAVQFYESFVTSEVTSTNIRVAEMVKLVENTSRDVQLAFANELAHVCDELNMDVCEVIKLANKHPRVNILQPGTGVGGHCIAVDPWFIINAAKEKTPLMQMARKINDNKPRSVVEQLVETINKNKNPSTKIACMGLAFKPDVDDLRTSPSCLVAHELRQKLPAEKLIFCEPHLKEHPEFNLVSIEEAVEKADIIVFLTAHSIFKEIDIAKLKNKTVFDPSGTFGSKLWNK